MWRIPRDGSRLALLPPTLWVMQTHGGLGRPGRSVWGEWVRAQAMVSEESEYDTQHSIYLLCDLRYAT